MTRGIVPADLQRLLPSPLRCKDCDKWYGQEDDEYGPCMYKHSRKEKRYVTYGYHECDEVDELTARVRAAEARRAQGTATGP